MLPLAGRSVCNARAMPRPIYEVEVFDTGPFSGNPVAVVLDADGLSGEEMQRFAHWTNFSETTFVLAPTDPTADYRVRIFTPSFELPFAGHPTLGSAHAWQEAGGRPKGDHPVQECDVGLVALRTSSDGRLAFEAPPLLRSGPVEPEVLAEACRQVRLDPGVVRRAEWVDNGPEWIALELGSLDELLAVKPAAGERKVGLVTVLPDDDDAAIEVRAFFPKDGTTVEDPVTGSLNASIACWLLGDGTLTAPYRSRQGTALGRRGRVHVDQEPDGTIWVGGATTTRVRGTVEL